MYVCPDTTVVSSKFIAPAPSIPITAKCFPSVDRSTLYALAAGSLSVHVNRISLPLTAAPVNPPGVISGVVTAAALETPDVTFPLYACTSYVYVVSEDAVESVKLLAFAPTACAITVKFTPSEDRKILYPAAPGSLSVQLSATAIGPVAFSVNPVAGAIGVFAPAAAAAAETITPLYASTS